VATPVELGNESVDDPLRPAIGTRRHPLEGRRHLGDPE